MKKLTEIKVFGLLEQYTYKVKLVSDSSITMIFAPNGTGKTKLLQLINSVFKNDYLALFELPFEVVEFKFHDNDFLKVSKVVNDKDSEVKDYLTYDIVNNSSSDCFKVQFIKDIPNLTTISRRLPFLRRINKKEWYDFNNKRKLQLNDIMEEYEEIFNVSFNVDEEKRDLIKNFISVHLIETNRLHDIRSYNSNRHNSFINDRYEELEFDTVNSLSDAIRVLISNKLNEFASVSQELDRTFPSRLVSRMKLNENTINVNYIMDKLERLENYRQKLSRIGLLDSQSETFQGFSENPDMYIANVLELYIEDTEKKLSVFNDLEKRITLFIKIINERYNDKQLEIDKNEGFIIKLRNGRKLKNINQLSSGEQHTLVMFFNLLFESEPNTLVLIDEPEISLHIEWQQSFLEDIKLISELTRVEFIVATHSPDIMNGNFELCVGLEDLGEKNDEES